MRAEVMPDTAIREQKRARRWSVLAIVLVCLVCLVFLASAAVGVVWWAAASNARDMSGLEGVWRDEGSPKHVYRFQRDGKVENSWGGLPFGEFGTWERDGPKITVHTIRNWDFEAELQGEALRGRMVEQSSGRTIGPQVWRREWPEP